MPLLCLGNEATEVLVLWDRMKLLESCASQGTKIILVNLLAQSYYVLSETCIW